MSKKQIALTLTMIAMLTLTISAFAADDLKSAFKEGELYGQFRTYYFNRNFDTSNTREDLATGGMLYYRTAPLYGVNLGIAFYTAQGMGLNSDDKTVYGLLASDSNGNHQSFSVLGESYIQMTRWDTTLKIGRQGAGNTMDKYRRQPLNAAVHRSLYPVQQKYFGSGILCFPCDQNEGKDLYGF